MPQIEDAIRDKLAEQLEIIEPGLSLIAVNHYIPNSDGTRGFIDILARDAHGMFVIIELKRSNKTAREALHEVLKYARLLESEKGISSSETSAIIISTHWDELRAPFSRLREEWDASIRGFELAIDTQTLIPISATEVQPIPPGAAHGLTPIHAIIWPKEDIDQLWSRLARLLAEVGADDVIGIRLVQEDQELLYLVLGTVLGEDPRTLELDYLLEDLPDDGIEVPVGYGDEYRALSHVLPTLVPSENYFENSHPDRLHALLEAGGWQVGKVHRSGMFARQIELYSDMAVVERAISSDGQSDVISNGSARFSHTKAWSRAIDNLDRTLRGNHEWQEAVKRWLRALEVHPDLEMAYHAHNPCDLVSTLVYGWPYEIARYLPKFNIDSKFDSDRIVGLTGILAWDGVDREENLLSTIRRAYPDPAAWSLARSFGQTPEPDAILLDSLGLSYRCVEYWYGDDSWNLLAMRGGTIERVAPGSFSEDGTPGWDGLNPFSSFLYQYSSQIDELVDFFHERMFISMEGAFQITSNLPWPVTPDEAS